MPLPEALSDRLRLPLIAAPMFIVSNPTLVIAQCRAGIVGSVPALNARPAEVLERWLGEISEAISEPASGHPIAPYAVNQICHHSNTRLAADMKVCVKHRVPIIITSLRPPTEIVQAVHEYGGLVFHDVINVRHAEVAAEQGVDGIIAVASGAGGHAGRLSPFALIKEIRRVFAGTLILSGAMSSGSDIAAAQVLGADLAYMGTRFIATEEANASAEYKAMLVESSAQDVVYTSLFSGVHGNYLKASVRAAGLNPDELPVGDKSTMNFASEGGSKAKAWRDIWSAGQSTGNIKEILPTPVLVDRLEREYLDAIARLTQRQ